MISMQVKEQGQGPSVIYLHGIGGRAGDFLAQLAGVRGTRNIAWNSPGYGASRPHDGDLGFADLSAYLSATMDHLNIPAAHLVGHSIGGMLALDHYARRPDQVLSLTLMATTPAFGGKDDSFKDAFLRARLAPLDAGQTMHDMAQTAAPALVGPLADAASIARVAASLAAVPCPIWRQILHCLVQFDRRNILADINVPTCIIAGSHDSNAPAKTMRKMAGQIPHAQIHVLDGIGHMIPHEAPDQLTQILNDFLKVTIK